MAARKNVLTAEQVRNMTEEEWKKFREESWKKKQEFYSQPVPNWYLKDKASYIEFMKRVEKRQAYFESRKAQKGNLTKRVEELAGDDVDSFADDK